MFSFIPKIAFLQMIAKVETVISPQILVLSGFLSSIRCYVRRNRTSR